MRSQVAPCSYQAARYAVDNWHYSETMPTGRLVHLGAWDADQFVGAIIFGRGASVPLYKSLNLTQTELCELVRVAFTEHAQPITWYVARALEILKQTSPTLRAVVSFADPEEGHDGTIYQAGNWIYTGIGTPGVRKRIDGRWVHNRSVDAVNGQYYGIRNKVVSKQVSGKHRYLMPLDKAMRRRFEKMRLPFPTLAEERSEGPHPQPGDEGGFDPHTRLQ